MDRRKKKKEVNYIDADEAATRGKVYKDGTGPFRFGRREARMSGKADSDGTITSKERAKRRKRGKAQRKARKLH